jgi:hypothetical protein
MGEIAGGIRNSNWDCLDFLEVVRKLMRSFVWRLAEIITVKQENQKLLQETSKIPQTTYMTALIKLPADLLHLRALILSLGKFVCCENSPGPSQAYCDPS